MSFFEKLFGKQKTPAQQLREYKRTLDRSIRELDRERNSLQNQEKKIVAEIKKSAKNNQMGAAKIQAKDLVRTRRHVEKFYKMKTQLQAVSLRMQTMKSTLAMTDAMKGVAKVMGRMNAQMNMPAMQRIMMEFEKQNEMLDMKEEMMGDTIDDVMDSEGEEEETEEVISKVLDEIGISLDGQLADTPNQAIPQQQVEVAKKEEDDLQARLDNLRKG
eukprot:TRINITY_DN59_c1_g2_i2.p1 TRINITY_DN59_c1_g2~~TRINITY_DN59_c1_g2_i2.p1  ORF type:complete len:216 (+),score=62.60 TRINITY_DN59_c1_g2_i2:230-877(+)